jgi:hypothetical protein
MLKRKSIKFKNKISYVVFFLIGCVTNPETKDQSNNFCDQVNNDADLYSYWINEESHDSLLTVLESCERTPKVLSARLSFLSLLGRYEEALRLISTMKRSDFMTPYDSISKLNYFKSKLTKDSVIKKELYKQTLKYISAYLEEQPTDTLAVFHYCGTSLEVLSEEQLYQKIDSIARRNDFSPIYELAISTYLSKYLERYKRSLEQYKKAKVI